MTILVAYVPRPEGEAAFSKGLEIAQQTKEQLVVVNAGPGGPKEDPSLANEWDIERLEKRAAEVGVKLEVKQFVRGNSAVTEVDMLVSERQVSLVVIGLRVRSRVGKLLLGSVAQDILLSVPCPVLAVKAS
jgi:nucleotide-binding universal stress UspA family protein